MFANNTAKFGRVLMGLVVAGTVFAPQAAQAVPPAPGGVVGLPGTTAAMRPDLAGVVIRDAVIPFEAKNAAGAVLVRGWVQDRVVRSDITGRLHFYFRVRNTWAPGAITKVERHNYTGVRTDVDWRIDGLGLRPPAWASRTAAGNLVSFGFPNPIWAGQESKFSFIAPDRAWFNVGGLSRIIVNGGAAGVVVPTAQPV